MENQIYQPKSTYRIEYNIIEPSKFSDYDYDPYHPNRRFISTYIHQLIILDNIMNTELLRLHFSSETCASIIAALYAILNSGLRTTSVRNVYAEDMSGDIVRPVSFTISRDNNGFFHLNFKTKSEDPIEVSFQFTEEEMKQLISLMETEEIKYMYIEEEEREILE